MRGCLPRSRKKKDQDPVVKYDAYAAALPAPKLFDLSGRIVVKLLQSKNAGLVIQTIGRVNRGDITSAYVFEPTVFGCGQCGQVRGAVARYGGRRHAVKSFIKETASKEKINLFRNEAQVLLRLDHPHIARLLEVWEDTRAVHFVMEMCNGGDLVGWLANRKQHRIDYTENEKLARPLVTQMVRTICYLHDQNVVHRDIKLDHWLIDGTWTNGAPVAGIPFIKLIDFGLARTYVADGRPMMATCGTLPCVAPEVLLGAYTSACDMWSLGVVVYQLITGDPPFYGSEAAITESILNGQRPVRLPEAVATEVSSDCADFVAKLLSRNPNERLTASAAFNHPWLVPRPIVSPSSLSSTLISEHRLRVELPRALARVSSFNFFRKLVLTLMACSLTSQQMKEGRDLFLLLDVAGNGVVSPSVLERFLTKLDPSISIPQSQQISQAMDIFGRGGIYFNDFICALLGSFLPLDDVLVRTTFWKFDRRRIGMVSVEGLREVLGTLYSDKVLEKFIRETDRDGDKFIDFEEFQRILDPMR